MRISFLVLEYFGYERFVSHLTRTSSATATDTERQMRPESFRYLIVVTQRVAISNCLEVRHNLDRV